MVSNINSDAPESAEDFYGRILGLQVLMDYGWIRTYGADGGVCNGQVSFAREGGNGTILPDISIEVDDVDRVYAEMLWSGYNILYELRNEEWGVRRFYVRDPFNKIINILQHTGQ